MFALLTTAVALAAQDYSSLNTPQEMSQNWIEYYARDVSACKSDSYVEGVAIERHGLHFYEASALAQRIVWVDDGKELYLYALLGGEGSIGPAKYRIRRSDDGRSLTFFGGKLVDQDSAVGERLIKCSD